MAITSYLWDFGDGNPVSSDTAPIHLYPPGVYTVTLTATTDTGGEYTVTKELYINVNEKDQSLLTEEYLKTPKCLHYDWDRGWSEYGGEHWVWPATPASVTQYEQDGEIYTLAWDIKDNKRYVLNTRDTYNGEAVYKDKDVYPIETSITLPEYTGELQKYDVSHLETYLRFRPELLEDDLDPDFNVDVALITDSKELPVETKKDVDTSREVTFYYQNQQSGHTQTRQLRIDTTESMYQLINYESFFKVNNRFRTPSYGVVDDPQQYFANAIHWHTNATKPYYSETAKTGSYGLNRGSGVTASVTYDQIDGPDGEVSGAKLLTDLSIGNNLIADGCLVYWYNGSNPVSVVSTVDYETKNGWTLAYFNGEIPASLVFPTGAEVFDVRVMNTPVTQEILNTYLENIFDNLSLYMPR